MISAVYVEDEVAMHPRTLEICSRFQEVPHISCTRYGEIFNRRAQNFRLQKHRPALILAHKHGRKLIDTPNGYGIGGRRNFYFSHMMNCLYDCRYCFLQGMYRSAHWVIFVNYEDFFSEIDQKTADVDHETAYFFSGYDCDSLAFEKVTEFVASALPFFRERPQAVLELRTKSVQIEPLLQVESFANCVVAFSFTPDAVSKALEQKVPSVKRRVRAMTELARLGWRLGLRFDPLIACKDFRERYQHLFQVIFDAVPVSSLHSVSVGPFRLPTGFHHRLERLYPDDPFLAGTWESYGGMISYPRELEKEMLDFCEEEILRQVPRDIYYSFELPDDGDS